MNHTDLTEQICSSGDEAAKFLVWMGILATPQDCPKCCSSRPIFNVWNDSRTQVPYFVCVVLGEARRGEVTPKGTKAAAAAAAAAVAAGAPPAEVEEITFAALEAATRTLGQN